MLFQKNNYDHKQTCEYNDVIRNLRRYIVYGKHKFYEILHGCNKFKKRKTNKNISKKIFGPFISNKHKFYDKSHKRSSINHVRLRGGGEFFDITYKSFV